MIQPLINISIGLFIIVIAFFIFMPKYGLISLIKKSKIDRKKILIEDALKFIYDVEYSGLKFKSEKLAENLKISEKKLKELISQMKEMNLISNVAGNIFLTDFGKEYALKVIRIHRLWERYLADETSEKEANWHSIAEQKEHIADENEILKLNETIGNALYDPHGDPIPTADGNLPPKIGTRLDDLQIGERAKIIHLEDEPKEIYNDLIILGFSVGVIVKLVKKTEQNFYLEFHDRISEVKKEYCPNVTVYKVNYDDGLTGTINLTELKNGEIAEVVAISSACRGQQRRRLLDFGIVPGSLISTEIESLGNDPRGYKVRGAIVALRNKTARQIFVRKGNSIAGN